MKKLFILVLIVAIGVVGYVVAGPYIAIYQISQGLKEKNVDLIEPHVNFVALRSNIKTQLNMRMATPKNKPNENGLLGAIVQKLQNTKSTVQKTITDQAIEALVTPDALRAMLSGDGVKALAQDDILVAFLSLVGLGVDLDMKNTVDSFVDQIPTKEQFKEAQLQFESPSRFSATVFNSNNKPFVLLLEREGIRWKLIDIIFPSPN